MDYLREEIAAIPEEELDSFELELDRLLGAYDCLNMIGIGTWYHDDQHPGELQKNYDAAKPGEERPAFIRTPDKVVIDSLEGNTLMQPRHTPVIQVSEDGTKARALTIGFGYEALAKFRETPMAIYSVGIVPGEFVKEDGEWRTVSGGWQRVIKADMEKSWIYDMQHTNTRPPLTPEEDANFLGRYAYKKDRARKPLPAPPEPDTFKKYPDLGDDSWKYKYAPEEKK
ncbi:MAG: hypothetical protein IJX90_12655 [Blautia sp.]|nr:hypothetical protein [Blautia sp.]